MFSRFPRKSYTPAMAITRMKKLSTMIMFTSIGIEEKIALIITFRSYDFAIVFKGLNILKLLNAAKLLFFFFFTTTSSSGNYGLA